MEFEQKAYPSKNQIHRGFSTAVYIGKAELSYQ